MHRVLDQESPADACLSGSIAAVAVLRSGHAESLRAGNGVGPARPAAAGGRVPKLADRIGSERVVWRYSPILLSRRYSADFHAEQFGFLAEQLSGFTRECKLAFLDIYPKIARRMRDLGVEPVAPPHALALARRLSDAARGIHVSACGAPDLEAAGVPAAGCIDGKLVERLVGRPLHMKRDAGQRRNCLCVESVDVGTYQTCVNGCTYCYANHSHAAAVRKAAAYDPGSPLLCDFPVRKM